MELINSHHVLAPTVYDFVERHGPDGNLLMMAEVEGESLEKLWPAMSAEAKESICLQLSAIVSQWRAIPKPSNLSAEFVGSANGGPCSNLLLQYVSHGPFNTSDEFKAAIVSAYHEAGGLAYASILHSMLPDYSSTVLTHGDLCPRNIMVKDGTITGIIDWEYAGWYPDHWEYQASMRPACQFDDWQDWVPKIMDVYPKVLPAYALVGRVVF